MFSKIASQVRNNQEIHPNNRYPRIEMDYKLRGELRLKSYYPSDIGEVLYSHRTKATLSRLDTEELAIMKSPVPINTELHVLEQLLSQWYIIFDKVFFFNSLLKVTRGMTITADVKPMQPRRFSGRYDVVQKHITICIHPRQSLFLNQFHLSYEEYYICVLLHEMTHAFIERFACNCQKCSEIMRSVKLGGIGQGHGPLWANAMIGLQTALQKEVQWKVFCSIGLSVKDEMRASKWQPSPPQLSKWELSGGFTWAVSYEKLQKQLLKGDWLLDQEDGFYPDPKDDTPLPLVYKPSRTILRQRSLSLVR